MGGSHIHAIWSATLKQESIFDIVAGESVPMPRSTNDSIRQTPVVEIILNDQAGTPLSARSCRERKPSQYDIAALDAHLRNSS